MSSLAVHSAPMPDGRNAMYTVGMHPQNRELYTEGVTPADEETMRVVMQALASLHRDFGSITEIQLGDTILLFTALDELPPQMTRCDRDARCFLLDPVEAPTAALPDREMCPVCLEPDRVHERINSLRFTADRPGEMLWCSNGHGVCVPCVRGCSLQRCACGEVGCPTLSFRCPMCRAVTPLTTAGTNVLIWGSWHAARQANTYSVSL